MSQMVSTYPASVKPKTPNVDQSKGETRCSIYSCWVWVDKNYNDQFSKTSEPIEPIHCICEYISEDECLQWYWVPQTKIGTTGSAAATGACPDLAESQTKSSAL